MDSSGWTIHEGDDVYGSDGDKVGSVVAVEPGYVVVEKGWFFPTDYYIPTSAIASYDEGRVTLNVTKEAALEQGWDTAPVLTTDSETTSVVTDADYVADDTTTRATLGADADTVMTADELRVPVYEEELTATTTPREVGGARIEKDVVAEERVLEVPVTEERLKVVRRPVDRPVDAASSDAFEEVIVDVPLEVEEVDVEKRVRVAEEVAVQKEAVQRTEQVSGTVRREDVTVTETTEGAVVDDAEQRR